MAFSQDGHWIFFHSSRPGGYGATDIYVSHRQDIADDFNWEPAENLGPGVNTSVNEAGAMFLSQAEEGRTNLYFGRGQDPVSIDMYAIAIDHERHAIGTAVAVSELNFAVAGIVDAHPTMTRDGKTIYFFSNRAGGVGTEDLWVSTRRSVNEPWSAPVNPGSPLNTVSRDAEPSLSFDGSTLLFGSNRPGSLGERDVYMAVRTRPGNR